MKRRIGVYASVLLAIVLFLSYMTVMPGAPHRGPLPEVSDELASLATVLERHVIMVSLTIGERRIGHGDSLERAKAYLVSELEPIVAQKRASLWLEDLGADGSNAKNVVVELAGASPELVIVGAHYDSAPGAPGANDNGSGVAAALELAKLLSARHFSKSVRFVFFANEEPPYFQNPGMGSLHHARGCRERGEKVSAMLSLESLGYYSSEPGSQRYPWPVGLLYPDRGNFIGFVGNLASRSLVRRAIAAFRAATRFPSEGAALPAFIPGVGWSDHWAFWEFGYPAIMLTDTATFRDPHYHSAADTPEHLDFASLARVTLGIQHVVERLAGEM